MGLPEWTVDGLYQLQCLIIDHYDCTMCTGYRRLGFHAGDKHVWMDIGNCYLLRLRTDGTTAGHREDGHKCICVGVHYPDFGTGFTGKEILTVVRRKHDLVRI